MTKSVSFIGKTYSLDAFGFLNPPQQWDTDFASGMARKLEIYGGLSEQHWTMINYLRRRFVGDKVVPTLVQALLDTGLTLQDLRRLFPTGYHRGACKIAGINYQFMHEEAHLITYETMPPRRQRYELDALGFLADASRWDEQFVDFMAEKLDMPLELSDKHWQVIRYLRDTYDQRSIVPSVYEMCTANDLSLEDLRQLFPSGYRRGACRMAGLPFFG